MSDTTRRTRRPESPYRLIVYHPPPCALANAFACICSTCPRKLRIMPLHRKSRYAYVPDIRPHHVCTAPPAPHPVARPQTDGKVDNMVRRRLGGNLNREYRWVIVQPCTLYALSWGMTRPHAGSKHYHGEGLRLLLLGKEGFQSTSVLEGQRARGKAMVALSVNKGGWPRRIVRSDSICAQNNRI